MSITQFPMGPRPPCGGCESFKPQLPLCCASSGSAKSPVIISSGSDCALLASLAPLYINTPRALLPWNGSLNPETLKHVTNTGKKSETLQRVLNVKTNLHLIRVYVYSSSSDKPETLSGKSIRDPRKPTGGIVDHTVPLTSKHTHITRSVTPGVTPVWWCNAITPAV